METRLNCNKFNIVSKVDGNPQLDSRDWSMHSNILKGKVHPKNMLVSDLRSDKIGKNAVDRFSISPLVLKIFAFKVEEFLIWRQSF